MKKSRKLDAERQQLAADNHPAAIHYAEHWPIKSRLTPEEKVSAAYLGVCHAAAKFDKSRNISFYTYAKAWMEAYLRRAIRESRTIWVPHYVDQRGSEENREHQERAKATRPFSAFKNRVDMPARESDLPDEQDSERLWKAVATLSAQERLVIERTVAGDQSQVKLAKELGISRHAVKRMKTFGLEQLRSMLA